MRVTRGVDNVKELIPFMNRVFHKTFPRLLPKLYTSNKYSDNHYVVRDEKDKVIGALASIPGNIKVYDKSLSTRGIGMVSCHKAHRGKGIMSSMLKSAIADAKAENADLMYLSGNRQRYEHYGFVPVGYRCTFTLTTANFPHMKKELKYTFEPLKSDSIYLNRVIEIYEAQDVRFDREEFLKTVHSWNIKHVYVVFDEHHNVIGHIATMWYKIVDFAVTEPQNLAYIVKAFAKCHTKFFGRVDVYPNNYLAMKSMAEYAQSTVIEHPAFFNVLNYRHVVEVLLYMESKRHPLADFDINIVIEGVENFNVTCLDNVTAVSDFKEGAKVFQYTRENASLMLFSPSQNTELPFTLQLFVPTCDNV